MVDGLHREVKVLFRTGPARRINARVPVKCVDGQARIVGKSGQTGRFCRSFGLDPRVFAKRGSGFLRLRQSKLSRRYGVDAVRRQQLAHFGKLARIMCSDHKPPSDVAMGAHITAIFCRSTSLATPFLANASKVVNSASENGVFSAVAWISTILPLPVSTKFASVSA